MEMPWTTIRRLRTENETLTLSRRRGGGSKFGVSKNGKRNLNEVYGYETDPDFQDYYDVYRFQDIATAVVEKPARSCWRDRPEIKVDDKEILEDELNILEKLHAFDNLERADILNRIGSFSVLFVGVPDGRKPDEELGSSSPKGLEDLYFTPYAEDGITISEWETEVTSERFGLPTMYTLQVTDRGEKKTTVQTLSRRVHWTRIIHMAEGALDSDVEGLSSLANILNRLVDLNKTIGGAAEAYFRNARGKYAFETNSDFKSAIDPDDQEAFTAEVESFSNDQKDVMRLSGVSAKVLDTPHADPVGTVKVAMEAISGSKGIPIRILTGVGAGQLAGNEDKASYNEVIRDRQNQKCTGWLLRLLKILSDAKMIKEVPLEAVVEWPVTEALNEKEKAEVRKLNAEALSAASSAISDLGGLTDEMQPQQVIEEVLGYEYTPLLESGIPEPEPEPEPVPDGE